jgi:C-terminal processing protease CtpA/Prc
MKQFTILLMLSMVLFGCEKTFIGEDEPNDPINNFEIFWHDFDQHYGLFQARDHNWDSIYQVYRPRLTAQTSEDELWSVFKKMISYLDDGHTFILSNERKEIFASGSEQDSIVVKEFSINLVKNKYLENIQEIPNTEAEEDETYLYANVKNKDIGYIYLNGIVADDKDFMDKVLTQIGHHKAIILDLRNNFGGYDQVAEAIAGRFADGDHFIYSVQERNGPKHTDFTEKKNYYTHTEGSSHFGKPMIVLTDRITVSAAEILLLHLNSFSQVTQIGDTTAGDFSDVGMRRFLPNGWQYRYSIMMYLMPDGSSLDGIGHIPDVYARNSQADIQNQTDKVLNKALEYLKVTYGIE